LADVGERAVSATQQCWYESYAIYGRAIHDYDKQIDYLARQHPEFALFDSFPGAESALVPRLIAALGTQRERYHNASNAMLQRNCAGGRQQRQAVLGTLALGLSQVHATDLSRVGGAFHPVLYLGESVLRETAGQGEVC
jgi:hypothetical protein